MTLTALDSVVIPEVEKAVRSITGSSGHGPSSEIQNSDRRDFRRNTEDTPLMTASSCMELNPDHSKNDETQNNESIQDNDFTALRSICDWRTHTRHKSFLSPFLEIFLPYCQI